MFTLYFKIQKNIKLIDDKLSAALVKRSGETYPSSLLNLNIMLMNQLMFAYGLASLIVKYLIIVSYDSGESFNLFFKQRELRSCPYSYHYYKVVRSKTRFFSLTTVTAVVVVSVATSLITNLLFGGKNPTQAATFGWTQGSWATASTTAKASHGTNQDSWNYFYSKDAGINTSGGLTISAASTTWFQTSNADFNAAVLKSGVLVTNNSIKLLKPGGTPCGASTECFSQLCKSGSCVPCADNTYSVDGISYGAVGIGTQCWLDRNLGAAQVAVSIGDTAGFGWLYQWGRATDGHQIVTSSIANAYSGATTVAAPNTSKFLASGGSNWYNGANPDTLWQGVSGINNPCPAGFRLPTAAEWSAVIATVGITNSATAFASVLKLPAAAVRWSNGSLYDAGVGANGLYWSSTISGVSYSNYYDDVPTGAGINSHIRIEAMSVRCIKD